MDAYPAMRQGKSNKVREPDDIPAIKLAGPEWWVSDDAA